MNEQLLSVDDAALRLGVSASTVNRMIDRGELVSVVMGRRSNGRARRRMVASSTINAYIAANTEGRTDDGNGTAEAE